MNSFLAMCPDGTLTGVIGLVGAAFVFMNAGRGMACILGLPAFVAVAVGYANGANGEDVVSYLENLYRQVKAFLPFLT